ncbi:MAG: putative sulfate exporter family transporter [Marinovum sp.]|nr:putative sulfate exporter family transporter [Marinovum sp.]
MIGASHASILCQRAKDLFPGVAVAILVAVAAKFLSEHYTAPAMLMALLLGIAVSFLAEEGKTIAGINFSARALLRLGVALLGARISFDLITALGAPMIALVVGGLVATILFGLAVGRLFGAKWRFSFLTAGSVAICGASAAMAIAAILPKDERSEERLIFTVVGVTVLSTIAMIVYPILTEALEMTRDQAGVFLGGTIHDVAQVVGAGFSISEATGDTSTLVKLIRVAMLAPVVIIASLIIRQMHDGDTDGTRPALLPGFVLAFLVLATINSFNALPSMVAQGLGESSRWLLLIAIAAVGMKTNLRQVLSVGPAAIGLIVAETLFIAIFILIGLHFMT